MLLSSLLLLWSGLCTSQSTAPSLPEVIPPTPEVAALGKYGEIPIGYYTGVPSINIPLVQLPGKGISIPVNLNYHASGIKVQEVASRVGLGWSLSAGGSVSRMVRGIPDDDPAGGYLNNNDIVTRFLALETDQRYDLAQSGLNGHNDFESDIYQYNLPGGINGKFFFDPDGTIHHMPKNNDTRIKLIKDASNRIIGWKITPITGVVYYIGVNTNQTRSAIDRSNSISWTNSQLPDGPSALINYVSSWHLMELETPEKEPVQFYYNGTGETRYVLLGGEKRLLHRSANNNECYQGTTYYKTYIENVSNTQKLIRIEGNLGSINLEYNHNRIDLKNDQALTNVILKDKDGLQITSYELHYDYFQSEQGNSVNYGDLDQRTKRLYLREVVEKRGENQENKKYQLEYNTATVLPDRLSSAQDYWGYYNGTTNGTLLPDIEYFYNSALLHYEGGDRKVYEEYAKACTLKKIIYPTGGATEFILESNQVSGESAFFAATHYERKVITGYTSANDDSEIIEFPFTISDTDNPFGFPVQGIVESSLRISGEICANDGGFDCPRVQILYPDGTLARSLRHENETFVLDSGNYTLKIENFSGSFGERKTVTVFLYGRELQEQNANAVYGGLRIAEIANKDQNGELLLQKKYSYINPESGISSGYATNPPTSLWYNLPFCSDNASSSVQLVSSPIFALDNQGGYSVGYEHVEEIMVGAKTGKTTYKYLTVPNGEGTQTNIFQRGQYPNTPIQNLSHRRGLLLEKTEHQSIDGETANYRPVQNIKNKYIFGQNSNDKVLVKNVAFGATGNILVSWNTYNNFSESLFSKEATTTAYYYTGGETQNLTQKQTSFYESYPVHSQITKIETATSEGDFLFSKNYYPDDITNTTSLEGGSLTVNEFRAIQRLQNDGENRISTPIQIENYRKNNGTSQLLQRQRTIYKEWGNSNIYAAKIQTAKREDILEDRILYHKYDAYGNPLEVSQSNGVHIIYIWGYNHQYPIAKIENASYDGMPAALQEQITVLQTQSNTENTIAEETALRAALHNLRTHSYFAKSLVTTFTFDPLIGITSVIDPKGYVMTYHYDAFNRLQYVKDAQGNLVSENQYHYKQ